MGQYDELFEGAFGYKPKNVAPAPVTPYVEPKKTYNTRDSVTRDNPIDTAAMVQSVIWNSAPPPPNAPQPGPAAPVAGPLTQEKGWGKTSG